MAVQTAIPPSKPCQAWPASAFSFAQNSACGLLIAASLHSFIIAAWFFFDILAQTFFIWASDFMVFMVLSVKKGAIILGSSRMPANAVPAITDAASRLRSAVFVFMLYLPSFRAERPDQYHQR